jgi:hypothetical protein
MAKNGAHAPPDKKKTCGKVMTIDFVMGVN